MHVLSYQNGAPYRKQLGTTREENCPGFESIKTWEVSRYVEVNFSVLTKNIR